MTGKHLLVAALLGAAGAAQAQSVIINEWSQGNGGNKEWIEALVVNGPVDMRGWSFTDGDGTPSNSAQLSNDSNWAAVPTGTIIVVYNGADVDTGIIQDDNFADNNFTIIIPHNHPTLMVAGRSFRAFSNTTATDNARLLDALGNVVHDWDQGDNAAFTAGTLRPGASQAVRYIGNTAAGVSNAANWERIAANTTTVGAANDIPSSANGAWILGLRGQLADDPDISVTVPGNLLLFGVGASETSAVVSFQVNNVGASNVLNVAGSSIAGPDAPAFGITAQPTGIAPGGSGTMTITFTPAAEGVASATLTVNSNDSSNDTVELTLWGMKVNNTPYAGLIISEAISTPTADEMVEVINTTLSPMDISGVIISDEDNGNNEGALRFPPGTVLAPGELIVVAVNNSATEPSWLDTLPAGVRVFHETARNTTAWTAANGNTITAMVDFVQVDGGTTGEIALSAADGVALYHPATIFFPTAGPITPKAVIDGFNYNNSDAGPLNAINSNGDFDTQATRVGAAEATAGNSYVRVTAATNTASNVAFEIATSSVGTSPLQPASVADWTLMD
jgi:hypothetical protein